MTPSKQTPNLEKALSIDYWLGLIERSPEVESAIKIKHCYDWIRAAEEIINKDGLAGIFNVGYKQDFGKDDFLKQNFGIWQHVWLQTLTTKGRYIADGTACQLDSNYPAGFYGFIDEAPERLRSVYLSRSS